jgi:uncharacterized protein (TIGR02231 family)
MKKIIIWSLTLLITFPVFAEKAVPSKIEGVTVYRKGAEINRTARANIPPGISTVVFEELSDQINKQTIQAKIGKGALILSVNYGKDHLKKKKKSKRYKALSDSLEAVNADLREIVDERAVLKAELSILDENRRIGGANVGVKTSELQQMMAYYATKARSIHAKDRKADQAEQKLKNIQARLQRQIREMEKKFNRPFGRIEVRVLADKAVTVPFQLRYLVPDAGWSPIYDLRANDIESPVSLTYKANVWQNTGIDWVDADLTISTGNPTSNNTAPVMRTWFIDYINIMKTYGRADYESANTVRAPALAKGVMDASSLGKHTAMTEGQLNTFFEIDVPYTIASGSQPHIVAMKDWELPASFTYYAAPRLDRDAFLVAKVTDWEKLSLLPGNANIFFEGAYVGTSNLNPRSTTTDTLNFSFGRDRKLVVKREKVMDLCSKKAIGSNKKETIVYDISVRNSKNRDVTLELMDQIPVTKNKEIVVNLEESSEAIYDAETGKLKWILELKPGERKVVRLKFTVKYPKGKAIPNL